MRVLINDIIELECISSLWNKNGVNEVYFNDSKKNVYQMFIQEPIPLGTKIKLNGYFHLFYEKENVIKITVKQSFEVTPSKLELKLIDIFKINDSVILTFKETSSKIIFKNKAIDTKLKLGSTVIFDLKKDEFIIKSTPHFFRGYAIENWIFNNSSVETFMKIS
jgi:hypothetical protein